MPRTNITLQIFLSSPSDVTPERDSVRAVVEELNCTWSKTLGIRLEVFGWETSVHPAFGTDAQEVINEQTPDDYDLFVAILWTRLGTPTPRAASGTVEEFDRALARFKQDPSSVQLMMFFKNEAIPPNDINAKQLAGIHDFRERIAAMGGLHREFKSTSEFENTLRLSLTYYVQDWAQRNQGSVSGNWPAAPSTTLSVRSTTNSEAEEPGFIDLMEGIVESSHVLAGVAARMTGALEEFTADVNVRTEELKKANEEGALTTVKRVTNRLAENMDRFVAVMQIELSSFSAHYEETFAKAGQLASVALDFPNRGQTASHLTQLADQMELLCGNLLFSATAMSGLREIVASTPRMTTVFNRAKRSTISMLDAVTSELESASSSAAQAGATIRSLAPPDLS